MEDRMISVLQGTWDRIVKMVKENDLDLENVVFYSGFNVARRFTEEVTGKKVIIDENDVVRFN